MTSSLRKLFSVSSAFACRGLSGHLFGGLSGDWHLDEAWYVSPEPVTSRPITYCMECGSGLVPGSNEQPL